MEYLEQILSQYARTFDITRDYEIGGISAAAYGYYSSVSEKYVITPKANLWTILGFEHILFIETDVYDEKKPEEALALMRDHMAPALVCKGGKYPPKDHMCSYLTIVYLCSKAVPDDLFAGIKKFRFEKDYLFNLRGHAVGRLLVMDMENGKALCNSQAKELTGLFEDTWKKLYL